jgi:putative tricarboxylic transport membrane protein
VVVFGGAAAATTALLGRHIDVLLSPLSNTTGYLSSGQIRVIAVAAPARLGGPFASVPTWKEQGYDAVLASWRSLVGPRGLSREQVDYWDRTLSQLVRSPEWDKYVAKSYAANDYRNSRETAEFLKAQYKELHAVLSDLGLAKR